MGLLNPGGPIAQFKRNRCSISPVEVILLSGVRKNRRDRGNQRAVLRGAEFRLQEKGSRAGALGAAAVWEVKRGGEVDR